MSYTFSSFNSGTSGDFDSTYAAFCQMGDWLQNYLGLFFETVQANYSFPYVGTTSSDDDEEEADDDEEETEDTTATTTSSADIFSSYSSYPSVIAANGEYGIAFYYDTSAMLFYIDIWTLADGKISLCDKTYSTCEFYGLYYGVASDYGISLITAGTKTNLIICKTNLDHVSILFSYQASNGSVRTEFSATLDGFNSINGNMSTGVVRGTPMTVLVPYPLYSDEYLVGVYRMVFDESSSYDESKMVLYSVNNEIFAGRLNYSTSTMLKC